MSEKAEYIHWKTNVKSINEGDVIRMWKSKQRLGIKFHNYISLHSASTIKNSLNASFTHIGDLIIIRWH